MNVFRIVQDEKGKVLRVEFNGVVLPVESFEIDETAWPDTPPLVRLSMYVDRVEYAVGEVDSERVVDAVETQRLLSAPSTKDRG